MKSSRPLLPSLRFGGIATFFAAMPAGAQTLDSGDTAWMLTATVLVILMTVPGLALFYGGMVRSKNVLSVLMQVFTIFALMSVLWAVYAYSLAFGEGNAVVGDLSKLFLAGITPDSVSGSIPEYLYVVFQMTFAGITPALIVGAFAERMKFSAIVLFSIGWLTLVYAPIAHMVWGGGWIGSLGAIDFAGGTVVHINSGIAGLVACLLVGPRKGYGSIALPPHNLTLTMIGASLLWVGWFGFNVGSQLAADGTAALVMINTLLAAAAAALAWAFAEWVHRGTPSMLGAASGAVAGLVAITPACANAGPMGAIVLGLIAGLGCCWAVTGLKARLGYDDSLDVFGVHGIGGIIGALGIGVFASESLGGTGFNTDGMASQLFAQGAGVAFTLVYSGAVSFVLLKLIGPLVGGLRVSEEAESEGLDITSHGESAYN